MSQNISRWLETELFNQVPCNLAIIDRDYTIVENNRRFVELFGQGRGRPCFEVFKQRPGPCDDCAAAQTFEDGRVRVNDEVCVDKNGRTCHNVIHIAPIFGPDGDVTHIIEMATEVTEVKRLKREYDTLFEEVPCYLAVLNRDLRIVRANQHLHATFSGTTGQHCYEVLKKRKKKCDDCPAERTFLDGRQHSSAHIGINCDGKDTHYLVTASPMAHTDGEVSYVMEMALDVTETRRLEHELATAHALRETLVEDAVDAVVATNEADLVIVYNKAAEALLGYSPADVMGQALPEGIIPDRLLQRMALEERNVIVPETTLTTRDGREIPARVCGVKLKRHDEAIGRAFFLGDLRQVKQLEQEKIDAERLAAVGQTVAGLAHGIKNILTGLEGGMYVVGSGLKRGRQDRVDEGWEMLQRNIARISTLVKNLLDFSKGRLPSVVMVSPPELAQAAVDLYADSAAKDGVSLDADIDHSVAPAPMDPQDIHTCLENLISNALDACQVSHKPQCPVTVRCREENGAVIFEVADSGCGMDYDVKQRAFTSFFTTKGAGGTGLGLLLTRKIVQQHGGKITLESTPGEGSVFRLVFPRARLPKPASDDPNDIQMELMHD